MLLNQDALNEKCIVRRLFATYDTVGATGALAAEAAPTMAATAMKKRILMIFVEMKWFRLKELV